MSELNQYRAFFLFIIIAPLACLLIVHFVEKWKDRLLDARIRAAFKEAKRKGLI